MAVHGFVAVVGARALPEQVASQVVDVVGSSSGAGLSACARSVVFHPDDLGGSPSGALGSFAARGGCVEVMGAARSVSALDLDRLERYLTLLDQRRAFAIMGFVLEQEGEPFRPAASPASWSAAGRRWCVP
ncbi:MAG: hypothetical protein HYS36_02440 [Candidatus Rokubacteria bacterium]|nr:hypothetical protein [Candidatus Rokubacteria bacterium]